MNKLIVNNLNKLFLTNDAGTILRELEIEHPAARLILLASQQQDREVGDATNLVIVLAGELLQQAEKLLQMGLKASVIVEGYELAFAKARQLLGEEAESVLAAEKIPIKSLTPLLKTVIGSKQYGLEGKLASLVSEAIDITLPRDNPRSFNVDNVRCVKIMGASLTSSHVIHGMVFNREASTRLKSLSGPGPIKVAVFLCPLSGSRTETKGTVLLHDAKEMMNFSKGEEEILQRQIESIAASGAKVVVSGDQISDLAVHYLDRCGLIGLRIPSKFDLRRLCRALGATPLARLGEPLAEELGEAAAVECLEIGSDRCTVFKSSARVGQLATIVLRGSTQNAMDDLERAIEDAVNTVRTLVTRDERIVPGAGASEMALSRALGKFADLTPGVAQYAIRAFAESFEVVPRVLAMNGGFDSHDVLARLAAAQESQGPHQGINLDDPQSTIDSISGGIVDSLAAKASAVHLAVDCALTILRVDQIIMSKPAGGPKPRAPGAQDEDD